MKLYLSIIIGLGLLLPLNGQTIHQQLQKAEQLQETKPDSSILISQKVLTDLEGEDIREKALVYWNLAQSYLYKHEYHTALFYGLKGKELFAETDTNLVYQDLLATIGWVYFDMGNETLAEPFHKEALKTAQRRKDTRSEIRYTNALGLDVLNAGQYHKALGYFRQALFLLNNQNGRFKSLRSTLETNIGNVYYHQENWAKAEEYLNASIANSTGNASALLESYAILSNVYLKTRQLDKCAEALQKAEELSYQTNYSFSLIEYYQVRYQFEWLVGNSKAAFRFQSKYMELYEKINNKEVKNVMNFLLDAQNEKIAQDEQLLKQAKEIQHNRRILTYLIIALSVILLVVFFMIFRARINKALKRQRLLNNELEEKEQKQAELTSKLAYRDEAIDTLALTMSKRNEMLKSVALSVSKSNSKEVKEAWKKFENVLTQEAKSNLLSEEFVKDFRYRLQDKYPKLTEREIQLIIDIRNNLTSKEMAEKHHIEVKSIEMSRYRLRKKLDIAKGDSIKDFIMKL